MSAPIAIIVLLLVVAAICAVSGVSILFGTGWALLAASAVLVAIATFLMKGL